MEKNFLNNCYKNLSIKNSILVLAHNIALDMVEVQLKYLGKDIICYESRHKKSTFLSCRLAHLMREIFGA